MKSDLEKYETVNATTSLKELADVIRSFAFYGVIMRFFYKQLLYFKVVFKEMKQIEGYNYREVGNLPIVGCDHFKGYEIINPKTNKVLYRKVKDYGYIGDGFRSYNPSRYNVVSKFFSSNAL